MHARPVITLARYSQAMDGLCGDLDHLARVQMGVVATVDRIAACLPHPAVYVDG